TVPADPRLWNLHDQSFGHYRRYDRDRLIDLWEGLPLKPLLVSHYNSRLYPLVKTVRTINRWRGATAGSAGTDFRIPPAPLNKLLENAFAGERHKLCRALGARRGGYSQGVSLIALLQRQTGTLAVRNKPVETAPDYFDPIAGELVAVR
ncbi:MAG TPA: hypothetical protein VKB78_14550, partial [Pirellulales bacterium]|nr:hypothetical protein [Pirellulales bacterium]